MIIAKQNNTNSEDIQQIGQLHFQVPKFEIRIDSNTYISKNRVQNVPVDAPVTRELAAASALINRLAMSYPELTVQTQANANRDKVKLLLEDQI